MASPQKKVAGRDLEREGFWKETVARWRETGVTQAEFCRKEHLNVNTFSSWKKILQQRELVAVRKPVKPTEFASGRREPGLLERPAPFVRLEIEGNAEVPIADETASPNAQPKDGNHQIWQPRAEIIDLVKGTRLRIYNGN